MRGGRAVWGRVGWGGARVECDVLKPDAEESVVVFTALGGTDSSNFGLCQWGKIGVEVSMKHKEVCVGKEGG